MSSDIFKYYFDTYSDLDQKVDLHVDFQAGVRLILATQNADIYMYKWTDRKGHWPQEVTLLTSCCVPFSDKTDLSHLRSAF